MSDSALRPCVKPRAGLVWDLEMLGDLQMVKGTGQERAGWGPGEIGGGRARGLGVGPGLAGETRTRRVSTWPGLHGEALNREAVNCGEAGYWVWGAVSAVRGSVGGRAAAGRAIKRSAARIPVPAPPLTLEALADPALF